MAEIVVVTDASADLSEENVAGMGLHVVPLATYSGKVAAPLDHSSPSDFWDQLDADCTLVRNAQPTPGDFCEVYSGIARSCPGPVSIVSIHASGLLSATVQSARLAADLLDDPEVWVIDSGLLGPALGQVVMEMASLAEENYSSEEIIEHLHALLSRVRVHFYAADPGGLTGERPRGWFETLVSSATGALRSNLFSLVNGELTPGGRARSRREAIDHLVGLITGGERSVRSRPGLVGTMTCGDQPCPALHERVAESISSRTEQQDYIIGPVLGSHLGRGSLGVFSIV